MQLDRRKLREPDQRRGVAGDDELDRLAPQRHGLSLDPVRAVRRRALLEERLPLHPVRVALEGQRAAGQMRHQHRRDLRRVLDRVPLGEAGLADTGPCRGW